MQRSILLTLTFLLLGNLARAESLAVTVLDQHGEPLADTVVEIREQRRQLTPDENAVIDQINRRFVPMVIAIHPGQSVEFPNSDNVRHHVYSFSDIRQFSTRLYADDPVDPVQFNQAGIATLGCNIHDSMVGYVYVSEWQHVAVSDERGRLQLEDLTAFPDTLHVWHPWMDAPDNRREIALPPETPERGDVEITLNVTPPSQDFGFGALSGDDS
ncbi:MAG: methylamine utilization protein [Pseudohongiellaceae bacterium]